MDPPPRIHGVLSRQVLMTVLIGTLSAVFARGVFLATLGLTYARVRATFEVLAASGIASAFFTFMGIAVGMVLLASTLTVFIAPVARGSGVPLIAAYLNGNNVPGLLDTSTLFVKVRTHKLLIHCW